MASLAIGKALGSVEKMDDEFEPVDVDDNTLPPELDCPGVRGGRGLVIDVVSTEGTSESDP